MGMTSAQDCWKVGSLLGVQDENTVFALGDGIVTEEVLECVCWGSTLALGMSVLANFM